MENLNGKRFGMLLVIGESKRRNKRTYCPVRCDCGRELEILKDNLKRGNSKNCGCYSAKLAGARWRTHGKSKTPEYNAWNHLIRRCENKNDATYPLYGGRGIRVCKRYKESFQNFWDDLGQKPSKKHSIDRIDNDLNYSCGKCDDCKQNEWDMNVRWGTKRQQMGNTRVNVWIEYNGEEMIMSEWARKLNIEPHCLLLYLKRHNSIEKAIKHYTSPIKNGRKLYAYNGSVMTLTEWANKLNVKFWTLYRYFDIHNKSIEKTIEYYLKKSNSLQNH